MLVIRRRAGQSVLIGDCIEIEVIEATAGKVKLGITAPREIPVLRSEIKLTGEQNRIAAQAVTSQGVGELLEMILRPD
jgi:carbon storage regulator